MEPTHNYFRTFAAGLLFVLFVTLAPATTIRPPSFEQLVENSGRIVRATVQSVEAYADEYQGKAIVRTAVTLDVIESLDSRVPLGSLTIRHLGGQVGDLRLEVGAMPHYEVGREVVLFLHATDGFVCPTVGWGHGKYFVDRSGGDGVARMVRSDGSRLHSLEEVPEPMHTHEAHEEHAPDLSGMSLTRFRQSVRDQLSIQESQQ